MRKCVLIAFVLFLSACTTMAQPPLDERAAMAVELAQLLEETAVTDPQRLSDASSEMMALHHALTHAPAPPVSDEAMQYSASIVPAPDIAGGRSLMHGLHLASYRHMENVVIGWAELQSQLPALTDHEARIEQVSLGERGEFLRLKAGPFDSQAEVQALCLQAQAAGLWCQPTHFTGTALPQ